MGSTSETPAALMMVCSLSDCGKFCCQSTVFSTGPRGRKSNSVLWVLRSPTNIWIGDAYSDLDTVIGEDEGGV